MEIENDRYFLGVRRMYHDFKLMISQFNPTLGDLEKNYQGILDTHSRAMGKGVDLVALPEMSLTGYQVQDLILKPAFLTEVHLKIAKLASVSVVIHIDIPLTGLSLTMNQGSGSALIWNEVNTGSAPITPPGWQEVAA